LYDNNAEEKEAPLEPVTSEEEDDDGGEFQSGAFDTILR
jgi:hypothetical protein